MNIVFFITNLCFVFGNFFFNYKSVYCVVENHVNSLDLYKVKQIRAKMNSDLF